MSEHRITIRNDTMAVDIDYHWPLPDWRTVAEDVAWQIKRVMYHGGADATTIRLNGKPVSTIEEILDTLYPAVHFQPEWREDRSWNR